MLILCRVRPQPSSLQTIESRGNNQQQKENVELELHANGRVESAELGLGNHTCSSTSETTDRCMRSTGSPEIQPQPVRLYYDDMDGDTSESSTSNGVSARPRETTFGATAEAVRDNVGDVGTSSSVPENISSFGKNSPLLMNCKPLVTLPIDTSTASGSDHCHSAVPMEVSYDGEDVSVNNIETAGDDSEDTDMVSCGTSSSSRPRDFGVHVNGHVHGDETVPLLDHTSSQLAANNQNNYSFKQTSAAETCKMNPGSPCLGHKFEDASGTNQVELMGDV